MRKISEKVSVSMSQFGNWLKNFNAKRESKEKGSLENEKSTGIALESAIATSTKGKRDFISALIATHRTET